MEINIKNEDFLIKMAKDKIKNIWVKVIAINSEEEPLQSLEGIATGGSINIDGASSVRRSCSLNFTIYKENEEIISSYWALNARFKLFIGVKSESTQDIVWFNQGIYILTSFSTSSRGTGIEVSIQGKDKMVLLNGEVGGTLTSQTDFGTFQEAQVFYNKVNITPENYKYNYYYNEIDEETYSLSTDSNFNSKIQYYKQDFQYSPYIDDKKTKTVNEVFLKKNIIEIKTVNYFNKAIQENALYFLNNDKGRYEKVILDSLDERDQGKTYYYIQNLENYYYCKAKENSYFLFTDTNFHSEEEYYEYEYEYEKVAIKKEEYNNGEDLYYEYIAPNKYALSLGEYDVYEEYYQLIINKDKEQEYKKVELTKEEYSKSKYYIYYPKGRYKRVKDIPYLETREYYRKIENKDKLPTRVFISKDRYEPNCYYGFTNQAIYDTLDNLSYISNPLPELYQIQKLQNWEKVFLSKESYEPNKYYYISKNKNYKISTTPYNKDKDYYEREIQEITTLIPIKDIIFNILYVFANEKIENIIINDLEELGVEQLQYNGNVPLYMIYNDDLQTVIQATIFDIEVDAMLDGYTYQKAKISELPHYNKFINQVDSIATLIKYGGKECTVIKFEQGDSVGYNLTDLVYPGELIGKIGESLTSILDKIINVFTGFEYFYDVDGRFIFQKKKTYVDEKWNSIQRDSENQIYALDKAYTSSRVFDFENNAGLIININNQPQINNIKNDFSVHGERKTADGGVVPIHYRYALDKKPEQYTTITVPQGTLDFDGKLVTPQSSVFYSTSDRNYLIEKTKMNYNNFEKKNRLKETDYVIGKYYTLKKELNEKIVFEFKPEFNHKMHNFFISHPKAKSYQITYYSPYDESGNLIINSNKLKLKLCNHDLAQTSLSIQEESCRSDFLSFSSNSDFPWIRKVTQTFNTTEFFKDFKIGEKIDNYYENFNQRVSNLDNFLNLERYNTFKLELKNYYKVLNSNNENIFEGEISTLDEYDEFWRRKEEENLKIFLYSIDYNMWLECETYSQYLFSDKMKVFYIKLPYTYQVIEIREETTGELITSWDDYNNKIKDPSVQIGIKNFQLLEGPYYYYSPEKRQYLQIFSENYLDYETLISILNTEIVYKRCYLTENETLIHYDWREILYQMAADYMRYNHLENFYELVAEANPEFPSGITGYEQYYTDVFSFWRQIYNPDGLSHLVQLSGNKPFENRYDPRKKYFIYDEKTQRFKLYEDAVQTRSLIVDAFDDGLQEVFINLDEGLSLSKIDDDIAAIGVQANGEKIEEISFYDIRQSIAANFEENISNLLPLNPDSNWEDIDGLTKERISLKENTNFICTPLREEKRKVKLTFVDKYSLTPVDKKDVEWIANWKQLLEEDKIVVPKKKWWWNEEELPYDENQEYCVVVNGYLPSEQNKVIFTGFFKIKQEFQNYLYYCENLKQDGTFPLLSIYKKVENEWEKLTIPSYWSEEMEETEVKSYHYDANRAYIIVSQFQIANKNEEEIQTMLNDNSYYLAAGSGIEQINATTFENFSMLYSAGLVKIYYKEKANRKYYESAYLNPDETTNANQKYLKFKDQAELDSYSGQIYKVNILYDAQGQQYISDKINYDQTEVPLFFYNPLELTEKNYEENFIYKMQYSFNKEAKYFYKKYLEVTNELNDLNFGADKFQVENLYVEIIEEADGTITNILKDSNFKTGIYQKVSKQKNHIYDPEIKYYIIDEQWEVLSPSQQYKFNFSNNIQNIFFFEQKEDEIYDPDIYNYEDYDLYTFWNYNVTDNPQLLNFWIDFMDVESSELGKYQVKAIGDRTKAINNSQIKSIYLREIPKVLLISNKKLNDSLAYYYEQKMGYTLVRVNENLNNSFLRDSTKITAQDEINNLIYNHLQANDTISLTCQPIYFLEPNTRILVRNDEAKINDEYIINKIILPLNYNGNSTITAIRAVNRILY